MGSRDAEPGEQVAPVAARKRAAIETYAHNQDSLRRTAQRYSICADDADDALQRAVEILLDKAPSDDPRELIRWTQTVVKHEALAVRQERERILAGPAGAAAENRPEDWVSLIPSVADGPPERAERREAVARGREALQALKPQERRALTLLAEGYSYREIGKITGFSQTKVNRCLAEGRKRFRDLVARNVDGSRCAELVPLLSSFCDGEAGPEDAAAVREHLRACVQCRATLRAYRAAPAAVAALAPALPLHRPLLDRLQEAVAGLGARLGGGATDSGLPGVAAAGGSRGAGAAALAKLMAVCVGTAGGAAACVATGVAPVPLGIDADRPAEVRAEREADPPPLAEPPAPAPVEYEPTPEPTPASDPEPPPPEPEPQPAAPASSGGAVEYAPAPTPEPVPAEPPAGGDSAAGEFGP